MAVDNVIETKFNTSNLGFRAIDHSKWFFGFDDANCMVDAADRYLINFMEQDCCERCIPCREGARKMHEIFYAVLNGEGKRADIERLKKIVFIMEKTALCERGKSLSKSISLSLETFKNEYLNHIDYDVCSTIYVANKKLVIA